jgi:hypothetical protein
MLCVTRDVTSNRQKPGSTRLRYNQYLSTHMQQTSGKSRKPDCGFAVAHARGPAHCRK